jgi:Protein of unknown function (DUF4245)
MSALGSLTRWCGSVASSEPASGGSTTPPSRPPTQIIKPKRGSETLLDMARSLGLVAAIVAVTLLFVPGLIHPSKSDQFPAVDYSDYISGFHQVTGLAALAPAPLPAGWKANAANLTGPARVEHLHIGFAVPGQSYAGLEESVAPPVSFARTVLGASGAIPIDHITLNGARWAVSNSSGGEYSLRRTVGRLTVIVTGSATATELNSLASSLR